MSRNTWVELIAWAPTDGTAVANTVTATTLLPTGTRATLPANYFDMIGRGLRVKAKGRISNIVTTPGTLTFTFRLGSVNVWSSGAISLNVVAKTNVTWLLELDLTARAIGASTTANLMGIGMFQSESVIGSPANTAGGNGSLMLPVSAPAVGTGFDSTTSQQIDLQSAFSIANAGNSIQLHQFTVESLN